MFCLGGFCPGGFWQGGFLSRGFLSGALCPGGFCHRTLGSFELDPTVILGPGETAVPSTVLTLTFEICCG